MTTFHDIETAPKDGTRVLVYQPFRRKWVGARWYDDKYSKKPRPYWRPDDERIYGVLAARADQPTIWMSLPEPPAEQGEE